MRHQHELEQLLEGLLQSMASIPLKEVLNLSMVTDRDTILDWHDLDRSLTSGYCNL